MPELHDHLAASGVNRVGDEFPGCYLFIAPDAGHVGITLPLVADGGGLSHDQACAIHRVSPLRVISGHQRRGNRARCAVAGERRHDDTVGAVDAADLNGRKQRSH